jgi:hypothetical protein
MFLDTRNKNIYGIGMRISTVIEISEHLLFKVDGTIPYGHDQHTIKCPLTKGKRINIYGLGVGISTVFDIFEHLQFKGTGPLHMVMTYMYIPSDAT